MKDHEEKEKRSALVVIVGEVTDEEIPQRMDKHARNAAVGWFSQVCLQSNCSKTRISEHRQQLSDKDSSYSIMTLDLSPEPAEEVLVVQRKQFKSKIHATMKIKGGSDTIFQVDQLTATANWKMQCTANKPTK